MIDQGHPPGTTGSPPGIAAMQDRRATLWMLSATALRMALALVTVKLTAVLLGVEGIGVIGQFATLLYVATALAGGGIATGIVQALSDRRHGIERQRALLATGHGYGITACALLLVAVLAGHELLARWLLPVSQGAGLLMALALAQFALFRAAALTAMLNSQGAQAVVAGANMLAALVGVVAVALGCLRYGLPGALAGMLVGAVVQWPLLVLLARRTRLTWRRLGRPRWPGRDGRWWWRFTLLAVVGVVGMPVAQLLVRNELADSGGWEQAGTWQAMVRVSDAYMQFAIVVLTSICLPRLAAASGPPERLRQLRRYAAYLLASALAAALALFAWRDTLVVLLFSSAFEGVADLFLPQLAGDVLRVGSYLVGCALVAAGHQRTMVGAELLQAAFFVSLAMAFGLAHGPLGVAWSHCAAYALYLPTVIALYAWHSGRSRVRHPAPEPSA